MPADRTERYLRRATRGLIGQARREVSAELRGAIDDKLYRLSLLGLTGEAALDRALNELGDPRQLAGGYAQVHTWPPTLRAAVLSLLAGAAILSFSSAQRVLQAVPYQLKTDSCDFSEAGLRARPAEEAKWLRGLLPIYGGTSGLKRVCLETGQRGNQYVKLNDVIDAFRAQGVKVLPGASAGGFVVEFPPGVGYTGYVNMEWAAERFGAAQYVHVSALLGAFQWQSTLPLQVSGDRNPTLNIGGVRLRLGSDAAPVWASSIYANILYAQIYSGLNPWQQRGRPRVVPIDDGAGDRSQTLTVPVNGLYALVSTVQPATNAGAPFDYNLRVQRSVGRQLRLPVYVDAQRAFPLVGTYRDLAGAQARGERAVLVLRLNDSGDLRKLDPVPVAANLIHLEAPR